MLQYEYHGKHWLREGFVFPGMYDYIEETKEKLRQPLKIPAYATARETEWLQAVSEKVQEDPYFCRSIYMQAAKQDSSMTNLRTIPYGEYPELYNVCMFASHTLTGVEPLVFLYTANDSNGTYNSSAIDYQDRVWIYISDQFFQERGMVKAEELCFLIGHELGHAQCHHGTIRAMKSYKSSDREYSADRAGMLVCASWILQHHPECTPAEAAQLSALYGTSMLLKLHIAFGNGKNQTDWETALDYDKLREQMDHIFDEASALTVSTSSHPHVQHRIMAMINFSQSQLFYRCMNLEPPVQEDLLSDEKLQRMMSYQLKKD